MLTNWIPDHHKLQMDNLNTYTMPLCLPPFLFVFVYLKRIILCRFQLQENWMERFPVKLKLIILFMFSVELNISPYHGRGNHPTGHISDLPASQSQLYQSREKQKEKTIRNAQELLLGVSMMSRIFRVSNYLYYCQDNQK